MRSILRIHGGVDKGRAAGLLSRRWPRASLAPHVDALGQAREAWGGAGPGFAFSGLELARGLQCMSLDDVICLRAWDGWAGDTEGGRQKARKRAKPAPLCLNGTASPLPVCMACCRSSRRRPEWEEEAAGRAVVPRR